MIGCILALMMKWLIRVISIQGHETLFKLPTFNHVPLNLLIKMKILKSMSNIINYELDFNVVRCFYGIYVMSTADVNNVIPPLFNTTLTIIKGDKKN